VLISDRITKKAKDIAAQMPILTSIKTPQELENGLALMEALSENYDDNLILIDALTNTIARYKESVIQHKALNENQVSLDPAVSTLKALIDHHQLKHADLEGEIGKHTLVSLILSGKRRLTRSHIDKLSKRFSISPALFF